MSIFLLKHRASQRFATVNETTQCFELVPAPTHVKTVWIAPSRQHAEHIDAFGHLLAGENYDFPHNPRPGEYDVVEFEQIPF